LLFELAHLLRLHAPNAKPAPTAPENLSNTGATPGTPDAVT